MEEIAAYSEHCQKIITQLAKARQRIKEMDALLESGAGNTAEQKKEILHRRALALAKPESSPIAGDTLDIVAFQLAHEQYGIESQYIAEVYPLTALTPIPCTPSYVLGVVNLRGLIVSVVDLRIFFELPITDLSNLNRLIVLKSNTMEFGILADQVLGTRSIPATSLQSSLPTLTDIRAQYLKGVTNESLTILDGSKLLTDQKIIVQDTST